MEQTGKQNQNNLHQCNRAEIGLITKYIICVNQLLVGNRKKIDKS